MGKEYPESNRSHTDPLQHWFLHRWTPIGIGTIGALTTIVFSFLIDLKLALGVLVAGVTLAASSWIIQFYRRQLLQREKLLLQREEQLTEEFAAAKEAREAIVLNREATIAQLETEIEHIKGTHKAVMDAIHRFIESTRIESGRLYDDYKKLSRTGKITKEALSKTRERGNLFLLEALEGLINVFRPLIPPVKGVPVQLWGAFRQHNPATGHYETTARHGEYTKAREFSSEGIPADRSIPKVIVETYNADSAGVVLLSPDNPIYDKIENDKFKDNLSIMAAPIIIGKEMPMFFVLNSPTEGVFHDGLKPYMMCCASFLSENIRSWSELVKTLN